MLELILTAITAVITGFATAWLLRGSQMRHRDDRDVVHAPPRQSNQPPAGLATDLRTGKFSISADKIVSGELRIAGRESSVTLRSDGPVYFGRQPRLCITGELYDLEKVTLIDCVQIGGESYSTHEVGVKSHSVTLVPHFVVQGKAHLDPDKPNIIGISFTFEDAFPLFYDYDVFGYVIDPTKHIETITEANGRLINRKILTGPTPEIAYFTGRSQIVKADTVIGTILAEHHPARPLVGSPRGIRLDNQIWVTIVPESPVIFDEAIERVLGFLRFITFATGRKQSVPGLVVDIGTGEKPQRLRVDWSHHPRPPEEAAGSRPPQSADLPLDPIHFPDEFVSVLKFWFEVDGERSVARARMQDCVAQQSFYSVDRLVAAANAYDHLPQAAVPQDVKLSEEVLSAKRQCKAIFRPLAKSYERESLLQALSHIGKANLKQKVRHRANIIVSEAGTKFPALYEVCDHAIDCRNYFVHGDDRMKFDVSDPPGNLGFLTDTLEFVFGASEFIDGGWDIKRFLATPTSMSHPYGAYGVNYATHLKELQGSCTKRKAANGDVENE